MCTFRHCPGHQSATRNRKNQKGRRACPHPLRKKTKRSNTNLISKEGLRIAQPLHPGTAYNDRSFRQDRGLPGRRFWQLRRAMRRQRQHHPRPGCLDQPTETLRTGRVPPHKRDSTQCPNSRSGVGGSATHSGNLISIILTNVSWAFNSLPIRIHRNCGQRLMILRQRIGRSKYHMAQRRYQDDDSVTFRAPSSSCINPPLKKSDCLLNSTSSCMTLDFPQAFTFFFAHQLLQQV